MPTKRTLRSRNRKPDVPLWARELLEHGRIPARGTSGFYGFAGWRFFGEAIPGLPAADSAEGRAIIERTKVNGDD
jgi:hypothetical protein